MSKDGVGKNSKVKHSSLDMSDIEFNKKKHGDMLSKACKLFHFGNGDHKHPESPTKKTGKHAIESLFKATHKSMSGVVDNDKVSPPKLQKQNSFCGYPIEINVEEYRENCEITRNRPSTICVDKIDQNPTTAALALERPIKRLSFKEPERIVTKIPSKQEKTRKISNLTLPSSNNSSGMKRSISFNNGVIRNHNMIKDDEELESQAMKVVRTVGQAFEVCHKLSITAPENDQDEQETMTQDLLSDRLSDVTSNKSRKDYETDFERLSLPGFDEDNQEKTSKNNIITKQTDIPTPTSKNINNNNNNNKPSSFISEVQTEDLTTEIGGGSNSTNISAQHEIQLLREQLEQQNQQTQAAVAQIQILRDQLAVEQAGRMEAQSRTHQLLVHNRELLDHIAALVSHLQSGSEKSSGQQQQTAAHVTLPQHPDFENMDYMENQTFPHPDFIENRAVTTPFLGNNNPMFNFNFPYENRLVSSLQSGFTPATSYLPYNYNPYISPHNYSTSNLMNNNDFAALNYYNPRHSYGDNQRIHNTNNGGGVGGMFRHSSEPRQFPHQYYTSKHFQNYSHILQNEQKETTVNQKPQQTNSLIKPLTTNDNPEIGRLKIFGPSVTAGGSGQCKTINNVGVVNNENQKTESLLTNLRLTDNFPMNGPSSIQRSTSEKVPNRSQTMSQMQRSLWARHTTK